MLKTIGIISPGEMGYNIALVLNKHGLEVVTCLRGRSPRTQRLAKQANVVDLPNLRAVVDTSDLIISVVVPSAALPVGRSLAKAIGAVNKPVLVADVNAISPMTSLAINKAITAAGGMYVDACIIGSAQRLEKGATFYVSGNYCKEFTALQDFGLTIKVLGNQIGQASAFKMVYAGLTKGLSSLSVELLLTAHSLGLFDQIMERYRLSYPEVADFMAHILPDLPWRAARRSQEMEELSATIKFSGLSPVMAQASGKVLKRVGELIQRSRWEEPHEGQLNFRDTIEKLYHGLKESTDKSS